MISNPTVVFERYAIPVPPSGCWLWSGDCTARGYGRMSIGPRRSGMVFAAHRISWEIHRGNIPKGMYVLHKCDVPGCVNPDHLYLGTQSENMRDAYHRGRKVPTVAAANAARRR